MWACRPFAAGCCLRLAALSGGAVLVVSCCVTENHPRVASGGVTGSLCVAGSFSGPCKMKPCCRPAVASSGGLTKDMAASMPILVVGRTQCLAVTGLSPQIPSVSRGCSQFRETSHSPCHVSPPSLELATKSVPCAKLLTLEISFAGRAQWF